MIVFKRPKEKRKKFYILRQIFWGFFDVGVVVIIIVFLTLIYFYNQTPDISNLKERKINETTVIYDRSGEVVLYKIFGEENRQLLAHKEIPDVIRQATIATEDDAFYEHFGIDLKSIIRAFRANMESSSMKQGASTITQQLARSVFLSREKTWERKIKEAMLALKIEKQFSKDEILDMYLNEIPYGANAYGIETATQTYFGKSARNLTLDEATFLAALPKAPSYYLPYGKNRKELTARQKKIIQQMLALGMINEAEAKTARQKNTFDKLKPLDRTIKAPHFVFFVLDSLEKKYGREFLEKGGLQIVTSLDWEKQKRAERILQESKEHLTNYGATNASLVAISPKSGQILAMVGSVNYFDENIDGQVNVSIRERQPGSSFKPIIYAKVFENGLQPETTMYDVRTNFGPDGSGGDYIPQNYDGRFHGLVTIRKALAMSLNIPAVKALYLIGIDGAIDMAERLGITTLTQRQDYGLALSLGGGAVNLLEETGAFSVFANDGRRNDIEPILEIRNSQGEYLYNFSKKESQVISQSVARKINSILSDNEARAPAFGLHSPLFIENRKVAVKTGTTQDYRDAWTVGYTSNLAVGVWTGNNDNHPMRQGAAGTFVAAPIWNRFMVETLPEYPDDQFVEYEKADDNSMVFGRTKSKPIYFKKKTGEIISEEKKNKMTPRKVGVRYETIGGGSLLARLKNSELIGVFNENIINDELMLRRWESALGSTSLNK